MKKLILSLLALTCSLAQAAPPVIWGPNNSALFLVPNLTLKSGGPSVLSGSADPSSVATLGEPGSLYLSSTGAVYSKTDSGSTTNWSLIGGAGGTTSIAHGGTGRTTIITDGQYLKSSGGAYVGGSVAELTGDQTIAGVKTFSSIPLLPATSPSDPNHAITKAYADALSTGRVWKDPVIAASTGNLALSGGATLTIDTVVLANGDRVLLHLQTAPAENGIYVVGGIGSAYTLTRSTDADTGGEYPANTTVFVTSGAAYPTGNAGTTWTLTTTGTITINTTALSFSLTQSQAAYTASLGVSLSGSDFRSNLGSNQGLVLTGNTLGVDYDNSTLGIVTNKLAIKTGGITNSQIANSTIDLTAKVTGVLPAANGGTAQSTYATGDTLYASASNTISKLTAGTAGQILTMAAGIPSWATAVGNSGTAAINYSKSLDTSVATAQVSNSTAETTMYQVSIPGGTLSTNKLIRVVINGTWLNSGASNAVTLRLKYGSTTLFSLGSASIVANASPGSFSATFYLAGSGATNTQTAYGIIQPTGGSGAAPTTTSKSGVAAEDSTSTLNLTITAQLSVATATTTFTKTFATTSLDNASDTIGSPTDAQYVTLSTNGSLSGERVLTGTSNQIVITDNGANGTVVLSTPQNIHTAATPTFASLSLSGTSNQITLQSAGVTGKITATPTSTNKTWTLPDLTGTVALTANDLSVFAATTSLQLKGVLSDETGSGAAVFANTPTLVTPALGAATATSINGLTITSSTGTLTIPNSASLITAGAFAVTLTATNTTGVTLPTTGTLATLAGSEAFTNKSLNGMTVTASTGTFTLTNAKTLAVTNTITLSGTDSTVMTFPSTTQTIVGLTATQTLTNKRVTKRVTAASTATSVTPNWDNDDVVTILHSAHGTFTINNFGGTCTQGQLLMVVVTTDGTGGGTYAYGNQITGSADLALATVQTTGSAKKDIFGFYCNTTTSTYLVSKSFGY